MRAYCGDALPQQNWQDSCDGGCSNSSNFPEKAQGQTEAAPCLSSEESPQGHKVSPKSTDPVHLHSLYSYLQNVNTVLLDSRLGPTLTCLLAEKS